MRYEYPTARMRYRGATERLYMNRPNLIRLIKSPEEGLNIMPSPAPPQHPPTPISITATSPGYKLLHSLPAPSPPAAGQTGRFPGQNSKGNSAASRSCLSSAGAKCTQPLCHSPRPPQCAQPAAPTAGTCGNSPGPADKPHFISFLHPPTRLRQNRLYPLVLRLLGNPVRALLRTLVFHRFSSRIFLRDALPQTKAPPFR